VLIPLSTDRTLNRWPVVTWTLLAVNILIFLFEAAQTRGQLGALRPLESWILPTWGEGRAWWQYVSCAFLHGSFLHLLGNMIFLWAFGPNVEDRLGRLGFSLFYLVAAGFASGAHAIVSDAGLLGASGAVAAVTGAYLVLFPRTTIRCLLFLIIIMFIDIRAWWFIAFAIAKDIVLQGFYGEASSTSHMAHLGGNLFGAAVALLLLVTKLLPSEGYDLFSIAKQAKRRQAFRELASDSVQDVLKAKPPTKEELQLAEQIAELRKGVEQATAAADDQAALVAWSKVEQATLPPRASGEAPREVVLPVRALHDLGVLLMSKGHHAAAERVFTRLSKQHPSDLGQPRVQLLRAVLLSRYLGKAEEGKQIAAAIPIMQLTADERGIAQSLMQS
jgi:membrane associated rhomboid family serine protease